MSYYPLFTISFIKHFNITANRNTINKIFEIASILNKIRTINLRIVILTNINRKLYYKLGTLNEEDVLLYMNDNV